MPEPSPDDAAITVDMDMAEARPAGDWLAMERARERTELALFGQAEPARLGRYRILDPIAGGGMGLVYGAYDPELDRRVALKILHPRRGRDERSHRRLITEARALAKLDHPNVVKVHDVLTIAGQVVIVMELVDGETLAVWRETAPRSWREIVGVYLQAGDGLAAAHGVDVIHRDFKPSNAIIGAGGRVRVLDFGLARLAHGEADAAAPRPDDPIDDDVTHTGDVVGTVGYSSPEQLRGESATAASDQFSFCVSLHHAIEDVGPFTGDNLRERLADIERGSIALATTAKRVPPWLRAVLGRGLSADPGRRYPTMTDLLAELRRPRGWRRWRIPMVIAAVVVSSVVLTIAVRGGSDDEACDGGTAEIAAVWNPTARDGLGRVIDAVGAPYSHEVRDRAVSALDRYAVDWTATHRATCRAHRRGARSPALLDRQMSCLGQRLGDLRAAVDVVARTDRGSLTQVMDVVARMPTVSRCADLERLQADVEPPETQAARGAVVAVRQQISTAEALARAGRPEAARAAAVAAVEGARATAYRPVQVEAALAEGRIMIAQRELRSAIGPLALARTEALKLGMVAAAVEAAARLLYVEGMESPNIANLERDLAIILPLSASHACDQFARPLLLNNIGTVYLAGGRRGDARRFFDDARADLGATPAADLELTIIDRNVAMLMSDGPQREALSRSVWQRLRDALGDAHPTTLDALVSYAEYVPDPGTAYELMSTATQHYHQLHPTLRRATANADAARAFLAAELADRARATRDYMVALDTTSNTADQDIVVWHQLLTGELALLQSDPARAIAALLPIRDARIASPRWYERADGLRAEVDLGIADAARGHDADAARRLESAIAAYPAVIAMNEEVKYRRLFARAQRALAAILRRTGQVARAAELRGQAAAFYRSAGRDAYRWLLDGE